MKEFIITAKTESHANGTSVAVSMEGYGSPEVLAALVKDILHIGREKYGTSFLSLLEAIIDQPESEGS